MLVADPTSRLRTSGTPTDFGPFETVRLIVEPFGAEAFGAGDCSTTEFCGSFESTYVGFTLKPSPFSVEVA